MPYVNKATREMLSAEIDGLVFQLNEIGHNSGILNYVITKLILGWLPNSKNYQDYNAAIGVLECVKQEFYRRSVAPYEDTKKEFNGDVF